MAEGNGGGRKVVINVVGEGPKRSSPKEAEALNPKQNSQGEPTKLRLNLVLLLQVSHQKPQLHNHEGF
ncbi:hypothetical protein PVK06_045834 [Gossypium arboreum]|uniref:Uncharacterized protein n=1 Tax=Gossypium arboreum TaxID=29729 RepID=A0ABR0MV50_GOSAR|nr:hypothetical protein PVK06_045834 [Gossypium arboreum]